MRRWKRRLIAALAAVLAVVATAGSAQAATPPEWESLASEIAQPWPGLMDARGRYPDYVQGIPALYPPPVLGYALIQTGLRTSRPDLIDTGLRTLNAAVHDIPGDNENGVFHLFAVASAYNLARGRLDGNPLFSEHRAEWERWLEKAPLRMLPRTNHYANKYMVEAVAVLELCRTGLHSRVKHSALANARRSELMARRLVNSVAPRAASAAGTKFSGGAAFVLSDPSNNALAYHALSLGFFARAIELLGPAASPQARRALQGVARASWGLQAPDGDLSYIGRSQGMAWTLSLSAYGAEVAAAANPGWGPRFRAVSDRAIERLATRYGNGPTGLWITPSRDGGQGAAGRALDRYATGPSYAGLTLVGLNWAIEHAERHDRAVGELAAEANGARRLSSPRTQFTVVRSGASWFAVRTARSLAGRDLRYDNGLVGLKRPGPDGGWVDVLRPRPHTTSGFDSAGPVLLNSPRGRALADAERADVDEGGTVTLRGGYRARDGHWLRRGMSFRYGPVSCGVMMVLPRRPSDRLAYSVWFTSAPTRDGSTLTGPDATVTARPDFSVRLRDGGGSGVDGKLVRAEMRFPPGRGPVRITICGR
jgi:hypothetical protein